MGSGSKNYKEKDRKRRKMLKRKCKRMEPYYFDIPVKKLAREFRMSSSTEKIKRNPPVTCGEKKGTLYLKKYDTMQPCIFSEGQWFTPLEFESFGGKKKSKNGKISILYCGIELETFIEDGLLSDRFQSVQSANEQCFREQQDLNGELVIEISESESEIDPESNMGSGSKNYKEKVEKRRKMPKRQCKRMEPYYFDIPVKKLAREFSLFKKMKHNPPVTCGKKKGTLYLKKYDNMQPCIFSEGQWFTPSQFERFGGKEKNKKWKTSIFYYGIPLQTFIEDGLLSHQAFWKGRRQSVQSANEQDCIQLLSSSSESEVRENDQNDNDGDDSNDDYNSVEMVMSESPSLQTGTTVQIESSDSKAAEKNPRSNEMPVCREEEDTLHKETIEMESEVRDNDHTDSNDDVSYDCDNDDDDENDDNNDNMTTCESPCPQIGKLVLLDLTDSNILEEILRYGNEMPVCRNEEDTLPKETIEMEVRDNEHNDNNEDDNNNNNNMTTSESPSSQIGKIVPLDFTDTTTLKEILRYGNEMPVCRNEEDTLHKETVEMEVRDNEHNDNNEDDNNNNNMTTSESPSSQIGTLEPLDFTDNETMEENLRNDNEMPRNENVCRNEEDLLQKETIHMDRALESVAAEGNTLNWMEHEDSTATLEFFDNDRGSSVIEEADQSTDEAAQIGSSVCPAERQKPVKSEQTDSTGQLQLLELLANQFNTLNKTLKSIDMSLKKFL